MARRPRRQNRPEQRDRLSALLQQADPDNRGTQPAAIEHYRTIAGRIIDARSELGIFTSMQQVTGVQGVSTGIARVLNEKTFLGDFNVRWLRALFRPIRPIKDFLNGKWLGHSLHAVLTDLPLER